MRKLSRIDRYEHVERSIRDNFSRLSPDFFKAFARFSSWFQATIALVPAYLCLSITEQGDGKELKHRKS